MKALVIMFSFLASLMFGVSAHAEGSSMDGASTTMGSMNPDNGDSSTNGDDDDDDSGTTNGN